MITLTPMSKSTQDEYFRRTWEAYRDDIIKAGITLEQAEENVKQTQESVLTNGILNSNQYIFDVNFNEIKIGILWLVHRVEIKEGNWYIYDIEIEEGERGKGLGKLTMLAAENFVKSQRGDTLGLNVFGFNIAARKLYESLGYETLAIQMKKEI